VTEDEATVALERLLAVTEVSYQRRAQLQHALESRVVIEQTNRVKLHELAGRIRPGEPTPPELDV
jgi:hypothetical protein